MNNEPSEASPQQQPEAVAHDNSTNVPPSSEDQTPAASPESVASPDRTGDTQSPAATRTVAGESSRSPAPVAPLAGPLRGKIQVGSRREQAAEAPTSAKPQVVGHDKPIQNEAAPPPPKPTPPPKPAAPVPLPSIRQPLSDDLERQFAAAMANTSVDEILSGGMVDAGAAQIELESRHRVRVTRIHGDNVFFSLGGRNEGVASLRQFAEPPELGAERDVIVKSYSADDGLYELVIPGAASQVDDWSDVVEGSVVEARITGANTGGLECKVGTLRGFIPASQIAIFRVEDYAEFLDQKLLCVITEANPQRKNLVLSRRAILEREKEEARQQLLANMEVGQTVDGVVRKVLDFGAFVDIGGVDGLVHVSQLSWDRVNHPNEVLQEGQKVRVKIEKVDQDTGKIGLSYRDTQEHPWTTVEERFPVESIVRGKVSRVAKFGAFVKLAPGVEGLVHISELSYSRVPSVNSVVSEGQEVDVKIMSIDIEAQRIGLSMKAVLPEPEPEQVMEQQSDEAEDARRQALAARPSKPLKGGTSRDSGGDQFGLKW